MNVTRDVIYDLLPGYFAGDATDDTRRLVEEFFARDPEFGRMAERFGTLVKERPAGGEVATEADAEKRAFDRARARVNLRIAAGIWALGALLPFSMAVFVRFNGRLGWHPAVIIGTVFAVAALAMWAMSFSSHPETWYTVFAGGDEWRSKKRA